MIKESRVMEAGKELDRLIAEWLGCCVEWREDLQAYGVRTPDRMLSGKYESIEGAWAKHKFPPFSTSVDAALRIIGEEASLQLYTSEGDWRCELTDWREDIRHSIHVVVAAPMPALAICRAWMAWKEAVA